ncbi:MAG: hypothetical protein HY704_00715 [Gemmatimonadetes bacterium]|nr:hypothetical protein [Gemmatimonadota bacterium]
MAGKARGKKKKTEKQIRQEVDRLAAKIAELKKEYERRKLSYHFLSRDKLESKIRGISSKSAFVFGSGGDTRPEQGEDVTTHVHVYNPDPEPTSGLYLTLFFGLPPLLMEDVGVALTARDMEWPYFSKGPLNLASGEEATVEFNYTIPEVRRGTYIGNILVWMASSYDPDPGEATLPSFEHIEKIFFHHEVSRQN